MKGLICYVAYSVLTIFLGNHVAFALPPTNPPNASSFFANASFFSSFINWLSNIAETSQTPEELQPSPPDPTFFQSKANEKPYRPTSSGALFLKYSLSCLESIPHEGVVADEPPIQQQKDLIGLFFIVVNMFGDQNLELFICRFIVICEYNEFIKTHPLYKNNTFAISFMILARSIIGMGFCEAAAFLCQIISNISILYSAIMFRDAIERSFQSDGVCQSC